MHPISIPATTPTHYISFDHALNLRLTGEDTGDWHFRDAFFDEDEETASRRTPAIAGRQGIVDTTPSLGSRGVREMGQTLRNWEIVTSNEPVYVANHYRAIADLAMLELRKGKCPMIATAREINSWLDTEEEVRCLVEDYLMPLRDQLDEAGKAAFDRWIPTVIFS